MSNQDEESKDSNVPSYQFFSADLNYNYFTEQPTNGDAPPAVTSSALPSSTANASAAATSSSATYSTVPSSPPVKSSKPFSVPSVPEMKPYVAEIKPYTYVPVTPAPAPVVKAEPERVAYSLSDDEQVTFEERVAAMERELEAANAASVAAQAAADAAAQAAAVRAAAEVAAAQPISPIPTFSRFADVEPIPAEYLQAPAPATVETGRQSGEKWNAYVQPNCVPDVFSPDFNFNRSLLKIFWRIDVDHNNRVSKNELALALQENWFGGDEKLLAKLLFEMYEDISPEAIFCDAGLSVNNILNYGPFGDMAREELEAQIPESPPVRNNPPPKKNTKSSQSLRSMFKR